MIKRRAPREPAPRTVDNIEDWYAEFLENNETTTEELDSFARLADVDSEFTDMLAMDYLAMTTMLVEHENTSVVTLSYVMEVVSEDWKKAAYVLQAIAAKPEITVEILASLFQHGDRYVREMVVGHTNVPIDILIDAARDKKEFVRARLTYDNPKVPDEALQYLADNDPETYIRFSAIEELNRRGQLH
ncbi:hypothetical protein [Cryobacterium sp. SO1]|uniref:hypothetical protein n=1 Tax=Cryobacterium sp. SO1 TaxID=1897061 RepID=UPI001023A052|nr:hypothetical protein [Cryobacterium sp. SO1]RZI34884.1 hypothetical protein BJQ95_02731 [Cryobacterium sp. SO1]